MLDLQVDGSSYPAVVKEMQRHPVKRTVSHIDFLQVNMNEEITVSRAAAPRGRGQGRVATTAAWSTRRSTRSRCRPRRDNMPNEFVIDVTDMHAGDVIRLADLPMPAGVTATGDPEMPIVTVLTMRTPVLDEEEAAAAEAAAEGEGEGEGAEGERRWRRCRPPPATTAPSDARARS